MDTTEPTTTITIDTLGGELSELLAGVARKRARILVHDHGTPIAAIVSPADLQRLTNLDEQDRAAWQVLEAMRAPFRGVSAEELQREADRAVETSRAERAAEREHAASSR
jgi:prevent-host-death family protein